MLLLQLMLHILLSTLFQIRLRVRMLLRRDGGWWRKAQCLVVAAVCLPSGRPMVLRSGDVLVMGTQKHGVPRQPGSSKH